MTDRQLSVLIDMMADALLTERAALTGHLQPEDTTDFLGITRQFYPQLAGLDDLISAWRDYADKLIAPAPGQGDSE